MTRETMEEETRPVRLKLWAVGAGDNRLRRVDPRTDGGSSRTPGWGVRPEGQCIPHAARSRSDMLCFFMK